MEQDLCTYCVDWLDGHSTCAPQVKPHECIAESDLSNKRHNYELDNPTDHRKHKVQCDSANPQQLWQQLSKRCQLPKSARAAFKWTCKCCWDRCTAGYWERWGLDTDQQQPAALHGHWCPAPHWLSPAGLCLWPCSAPAACEARWHVPHWCDLSSHGLQPPRIMRVRVGGCGWV